MTNRKNQRRIVALVATLGLVIAACGGDDGPDAGNSGIGGVTAVTSADHEDGEEADDDHPSEFNFGEPADAADADRVIEIKADDDMTFDPDNVQVKAGEIITFRVENIGNLPHDFTLGDAELQDLHGVEMADMPASELGVGDDDPNAFTVLSGETKELTWQFTEATGILMGCQIPGHYAAGMKGEITIEA